MDLKQLFDDLIRFEIDLWNAIDVRLRAECGLRLGSFDTMQVIARTPACRVHDIARELAITVGGTSKLVDRIEAAGHCVRRFNPDDRRSSIIELTPAGAALLADATNVFERELELRFGSVLSPRALAQLATALAKLRAAGATMTLEPAPEKGFTE
jgi:MarR family transcriptional regulator, organic hydroperoxide resistance regulator